MKALLHLAGVGREPHPDVVSVLLHHGLQLQAVHLHLLPGLAHVNTELVAQLLQVHGQMLCSVLGVGGQLSLQVVLVCSQLRHAVVDQGAVQEGRQVSGCFCEALGYQNEK